MNPKDAKIWKRVVGKVRGGFGETDFDKKIIKIDKKKHKSGKWGGIPKQDSTLINTIVHEELHVKHPKKTEVQIRKLARSKVSKMGDKIKRKLYNKFK